MSLPHATVLLIIQSSGHLCYRLGTGLQGGTKAGWDSEAGLQASGFRLVPELARCLVVLSSVWVSPASFSVLFLVKTQHHWCGGYFLLCGITKCQRVGQVFGVWSLIVRWFYFTFLFLFLFSLLLFPLPHLPRKRGSCL